jgi:hypothetical protein
MNKEKKESSFFYYFKDLEFILTGESIFSMYLCISNLGKMETLVWPHCYGVNYVLSTQQNNTLKP